MIVYYCLRREVKEPIGIMQQPPALPARNLDVSSFHIYNTAVPQDTEVSYYPSIYDAIGTNKEQNSNV